MSPFFPWGKETFTKDGLEHPPAQNRAAALFHIRATRCEEVKGLCIHRAGCAEEVRT